MDATHHPQINIAQRFVRTAELDQIYAAVVKIISGANVTKMKLEAFKYYCIPNNNVGVAGIVVKPTPALLKLQQEVIASVTPFTVETGTSFAFVTTPDDLNIAPLLIDYVSNF